MDFTVLKTKVSVSPFFFAVLTLVLVSDKTGVTSLAVLFSLLHELGHVLALICGKIVPKCFELNLFGMHILLPENLSTAEKIPVLMAGFTLNFLLAVLFFVLNNPVLGYVNLIIVFFTASPLPSTDGGEILKTILNDFVPQKAKKVFKNISGIFVILFSAAFILIFVLTENYFIFIAVIYMILCAIKTAAR